MFSRLGFRLRRLLTSGLSALKQTNLIKTHRLGWSSSSCCCCCWRGRHRRRVVLHDQPGPGGSAGPVPPEREAEARPFLHGPPVLPPPGEGIGAGQDGEVPVHAGHHGRVLHHPQLGQPSEALLFFVRKKTQQRRQQAAVRQWLSKVVKKMKINEISRGGGGRTQGTNRKWRRWAGGICGNGLGLVVRWKVCCEHK